MLNKRYLLQTWVYPSVKQCWSLPGAGKICFCHYLCISSLVFNGVSICTNRTKCSLPILRLKIKHLVILGLRRFHAQCVSCMSSSCVVEREARNARLPPFFLRSVPLHSKLLRAAVALPQHKAVGGQDSPAPDKWKQREWVKCQFLRTKQNPTVFAALARTINSNTVVAHCGKTISLNH